MVVDKATRKLLGIPLVGEGDVSKRLDVAATAMTLGATIDQISNLDLGYAPPYSPAIDSILSGSNVVQNKMNGVSHSLSPLEVARLMSTHTDMVVLDVRTRGAIEVCHVGLRSYEACQYLRSAGFDNAFFMEGVLSLWQPRMIAHNQSPLPTPQPEAEPAVAEAEELAEA